MISNKSIRRAFTERFGGEAGIIARAPGRINLIGEHTDYNGGFVLPAAIDYEIRMAARVSGEAPTRLWSVNYKDGYEFNTGGALPQPAETHWYSYFLAVIAQFQARGIAVPALDVAIHGDVPLGAGLSSSAAFEVCAATLINAVCNAGLNRKEVALLAQAAEHSPWVGVRCGVMDQFASALGAENAVLKLDCHTLDHEAVPFDSTEAAIVIINSNKPRELRSSDYNRRRQECETGLQLLNELAGGQWETLRHVPQEAFIQVADQLPEVVARRVRHNLTENARVLAFVDALRQINWPQAGQLLYQSHASLRDEFEVSCAELDAIVDIAEKSGLVYGCRMTGGGFGGCAVALVPPQQVNAFRDFLLPEYEARTGLQATVYITSPAAGAEILN